MATNRKLLIERLTEDVKSVRNFKGDMNGVSWGYQQGVLITGYEAELFIRLLKAGDE